MNINRVQRGTRVLLRRWCELPFFSWCKQRRGVPFFNLRHFLSLWWRLGFFFFLPSLGDESNFLLFKVKKVGPLNTPRQENYRSNLWACFCAALCVHLLYNLLLYWRIWRACVCQGAYVALQDMEKHVIVICLFCSWLDGPHTSCTAAPAPFSSRNYSLYLLPLRSGPTTEQVAVYPMPSIWLYWSGQ